jgi:RNA polymerase sigma-70 factor (ECF subfamily)
MNIRQSYQRTIGRVLTSLTYTNGVNMITKPFRQEEDNDSAMNFDVSKKEITAMLRAWGDGSENASEEFVRAVYSELRIRARYQLRRERHNHTLQTSALINEAYLKLVEQRSVDWHNREQFFGLAAKMMRRILVDHAKTRHRQKRGGNAEDLALDEVSPGLAIGEEDQIDVIALDEALERLAKLDKQQVQIVELRYFSGLDVKQTADVLGISPTTVKRDWAIARAWLKHELEG